MDQPFIIAITGSIAKTSTKVAVGAVLRRAYPDQVRVGYGNLNSFLGVPLAILGFKLDFYKQKITWQWLGILLAAVWRTIFNTLPEYIVLEYGADNPGDIKALAQMLPLDGAIITITSPAHLANYASVEDIAKEKAQIMTAVKKNGWALVNQADPHLKIYQAIKTDAVVIKTETVDIAVNFARQVGLQMKISSEAVEQALGALVRPEGRFQMKDLGPIKLMDDSYNANPLSMTAALAMLAKMPSPRLAILGDMLELGPPAEKYHQQVGKEARAVANHIVGVGQLASFYQADQLFATADEAIPTILSTAGRYGSILVKGSHGVKMDKIVMALTKKYQRRTS